jgi:integrase
MNKRKQNGTIVAFSGRWYLRYYEPRLIDGVLVRKRVSHVLGPVTTRGKTPPQEIKDEAELHMLTFRKSELSGEPSVAAGMTVTDFVEQVYLPHVQRKKRPSTYKGYRDIWKHHLKPILAGARLPLTEVKTFHVQQWLDRIAEQGLSINSLRHVKATVSGIFTFAAQQQYVGEENRNPAQKTVISDQLEDAAETHAYSLDDVLAMLRVLPEPAATIFAVAAYAGLRLGEIQGLDWADWREDADSQFGALHISRSVWNGHVGVPKSKKSKAAVPVIPTLAKRLALYRERCGSAQRVLSPVVGPMFINTRGGRVNLNNLLKRVMLPALNRCRHCGGIAGKSHLRQAHAYERDPRIPAWHGWHAARRGVSTNLYSLGVQDKVIQRILRHSNVAVTLEHYVKTIDADVISAMAKLEQTVAEKTAAHSLWDSDGTVNLPSGATPELVN